MERPKIGIAVFITSPKHPNCVILGVRKGCLGEGYYAPPGGHMEYGEEFLEAAAREVLEETGLKLKNLKQTDLVNAVWGSEKYHYVIIVTQGEIDETHRDEPVNMEPHKCEGWEWFDWDKLPENVFRPIEIILEHCSSSFQ